MIRLDSKKGGGRGVRKIKNEGKVKRRGGGMVGSWTSDKVNHFPLKLPLPRPVFRSESNLLCGPLCHRIHATSSWIQRTGKKRIRGREGSLRLSDEVNSECKG